MEKINIVIIGDLTPAIVKNLITSLEEVFSYEFQVYARIPPPKKCLVEPRGQYDASCILDRVLRYPGYRVIGIISEDLFVMDFNFVFGLAAPQMGCVVSTFRLRHENPKIFLERLKKEVMHELGHTFGLKHCENHCVMNFSNTVFDVDNKPAKFCDSCSKIILEHLR